MGQAVHFDELERVPDWVRLEMRQRRLGLPFGSMPSDLGEKLEISLLIWRHPTLTREFVSEAENLFALIGEGLSPSKPAPENVTGATF